VPVLRNIGFLATCRAGGAQGEVHQVREAAVAWRDDTIAWVGPERDLPADFRGDTVLDAGGGLVVPGLVDCHTHLAFGGWRADEFEQRIAGATYLEIARRGGGIASTVARTRAATDDELLAGCRSHLTGMRALGVTTVECKSGYGLDPDAELRLLKLYRRLAEEGPTRVVATLLGAHVVGPEFRERRDEYVDLVIGEMIPRAAVGGLARFCDVFVEETAFSVAEARRILRAGQAAGLGAKLHADQLSTGGGAELAAELGAVSADHLERISDGGIEAMARAGTVAVSLPLASLYLHQPPLPARRLIEAGVPVAVATDFNPGSAPSWHLPLALTLACTMQRMTPAEALKGATIIAARAIGLDGAVGSVEPGKRADLAVIGSPDPNHWLYHFRPNACRCTILGGRVVHEAVDA
jgi:imidazolonepropionase